MAIIRQGGYTENDSSDKLREKRKKIIEEERIFQLNESLIAYLDKLFEKYELINKPNEKTDEITYPSREELEEFTTSYSNTKPKGF
jgi:hypothetical protein